MLSKNMGVIDKMMRLFGVLIIGALYFVDAISGTAAIVLGIFALILALTSFVGVCPLYLPFGISTLEKQRKTSRKRRR